MEIIYKLTFRAEEHPELVGHLNRTFAKWNRGQVYSRLDISDQDFRWAFISDYLKNHDIPTRAETIFTKEELSAANWLCVRSNWHWSYPQPETGYQTVTYATGICPTCHSGLVQTSPFRLKSAPKWGKRHFLSLNWVYDELFTDDVAAAALSTLNIATSAVENKSGTATLPGVHQVLVPQILPPGFHPDDMTVRKSSTCAKCGVTKYVTRGAGMLRFRREIVQSAPHIVKTAEVFGDGALCCRQILISQTVYRMLTAENLDRGLVFAPVDLV